MCATTVFSIARSEPVNLPPEEELTLEPSLEQALASLVHAYHNLTPDTLEHLLAHYAPQARFKDPFNEVQGLPAIGRIFQHMFVQVAEPRFSVHTQLRQGREAMLGWQFSFRSGQGRFQRAIAVRGVSHLRFDTQGRVCEHRDYWDAAEELYAKFPLLGPVMRWLARRLAAPGLAGLVLGDSKGGS